ncbi:hypothetical protein HETIRDRAFT_380161, partial [Heterobasidion irregulare TC 32-1]
MGGATFDTIKRPKSEPNSKVFDDAVVDTSRWRHVRECILGRDGRTRSTWARCTVEYKFWSSGKTARFLCTSSGWALQN